MDEDHYRSTYHSINQRRCIFEKAINSRRFVCCKSARFCLADREGVACTSELEHGLCGQLLGSLRQNASFALQLTRIDKQLTHGKEIKVQNGGLSGLRQLLGETSTVPEELPDIQTIIKEALARYGSIDQLPYTLIVKSIVSYQARTKRKQRN